MDAYHTQLISIFIASIFAWTYLLKRLWSYKLVPKNKKTTWTFIMIFLFSQATTLYYIWVKDDQLFEENEENKKLAHNQTTIPT